MDASAVSNLMPVIDGFPRPDWISIQDNLEAASETEAHDEWCSIGRTWMSKMVKSAGQGYTVSETENFFILSNLSRSQSVLLNRFVERTRTTILKKLHGIAQDEGYGKHILLIFGDNDAYYKYISHHYPDGEFPLSAGVYLGGDYGHMAIPFVDVGETEATFAHEFTHCCLRHLPIPLWLDEGLAVTLEDEVCGNRPLRIDAKQLSKHEKFWSPVTIQEFWSGDSFNRVDEGNELSYELARYCLKALAHDLQEFILFVNHSSYKDGGEAAAIEIYEGSLGGLPYQFFGEGDWIPKPETWEGI